MSDPVTKKHILVVDDDTHLVDTVKTELEGVGYRVSYAYQSAEGMTLVRQARPDLILLDIGFATHFEADAGETSRRPKSRPRAEVPVIILSGVKKMLDVPGAESQLPVKGFLEKPFEPQQLLTKIEEVLGKHG